MLISNNNNILDLGILVIVNIIGQLNHAHNSVVIKLNQQVDRKMYI